MGVYIGEDEEMRSGDDVGNDITCYDCGEKFIEGTRDKDFVLCKNGCRGAYVYKEVSKWVQT